MTALTERLFEDAKRALRLTVSASAARHHMAVAPRLGMPGVYSVFPYYDTRRIFGAAGFVARASMPKVQLTCSGEWARRYYRSDELVGLERLGIVGDWLVLSAWIPPTTLQNVFADVILMRVN